MLSKIHIDKDIIHREIFQNAESISNNFYHKGIITPGASAGFVINSGHYCYDFDGSTTIISLSDIVIGIKSISFWIYLDNTTKDIINFDGGTHFIIVSSGILSATGFSSPIIYVDGVATTTISGSAWHRVTVTTETAFNGTVIILGKKTTYFDGKLGDFILWNRTLTASEASLDYKNALYSLLFTNGLLFDVNAAQGVIRDQTGQRTIVNTTTTVVSYSTLQVMNFDGATSTLALGSDFLGVTDLTIMGWIRAFGWGETSSDGRIITNTKVILKINITNATLNFSSNGSTFAVAATNALTLGNWYFTAITRTTDGTVNFYVGNPNIAVVLSGTANQSSGTPAVGSTVYLGSNNGATTFNGLFLGIKSYNKILTLEQITQEWLSTKRGFVI